MGAGVLLLAALFAGVPVDTAGVRLAVDALYRELSGPDVAYRVELQPWAWKPPEGASRWRVARPAIARPGPLETLELAWFDDASRYLRRDHLAVRLTRQERVWVATSRQDRDRDPDFTSLSPVWRSTETSRRIPADSATLSASRIRRTVAEGEVVWRDALEPRPVFREGEPVVLRSLGTGTVAEVEGKALVDGIPGRTALVLTPFGTRITGRVGDDGAVLVGR